jgi:hypothetical protein
MRGFFQQVYYTGKERERDCHGRDKGGFTLNRSLVVGNISNCVLDFYGTQIAFRADTNAYVYCSTLDVSSNPFLLFQRTPRRPIRRIFSLNQVSRLLHTHFAMMGVSYYFFF